MSRECQIIFKANVILKKITSLSQRLQNFATITNVERKKVTENFEQNFNEQQINIVEKVITANTEISRCHLTPELKLHLLTPKCRLYNEPITYETFSDPSSVNNYEKRIFYEPFWSIYWPGGQALTRFILDYGKNLLNKSNRETSFLDIGSGCGASAIAAKMIGASRAVANDINEGTGTFYREFQTQKAQREELLPVVIVILSFSIGMPRTLILTERAEVLQKHYNKLKNWKPGSWICLVACVAANLNASLNGVVIETTSKNLLANQVRNNGCRFDVILIGDLLYDDDMTESLISWLEKTVRENRSRVYLGDPGRHALTDALKRRMELKEEYLLPENVKRENYGYDSAAVWQFKID